MKSIILLFIILLTNNVYGWDTITIIPSDKKVTIDGQSLVIDEFPNTIDCTAIKVTKEDGVFVETKHGHYRNNDIDLEPYIRAWTRQKEKNSNPPPVIKQEETRSNILSIILIMRLQLQAIQLELEDDPTNKELKDEETRLKIIYDSYKKKLKN